MQRIITTRDAAILTERKARTIASRLELADAAPPIDSASSAAAASGGSGGTHVDDYKTRLQKAIPAEVVAGFLAIDGIVRSVPKFSANHYWFVYTVLVLLCAGYAWKSTRVAGLPVPYKQIVAATIAFVVWTYAIGGPFEFSKVSWWSMPLGGIFVILCTLTAPLLVK